MNKNRFLALYFITSFVVAAVAEGAVRDPAKAVAAVSEWNSPLQPTDRHDKYCKMAKTPFFFYRGSNYLFWMDFADDSRLRQFGNERTRTWLQGDMHIENMGTFSNASGQVVYDLNDFDDSVVNDYQYDLWRMTTSLVLVSRQNGIVADEESGIVGASVQAYRDAVASYIGNDQESTTRFTSANTTAPLQGFIENVENEEDDSREDMLDKWAPKTDDNERNDLSDLLLDMIEDSTPDTAKGRRFNMSLSVNQGVRATALDKAKDNSGDTVARGEKLAVVSATERTAIQGAMADYRATLQPGTDFQAGFFGIKDLAIRLLAGTGSLGEARYYALIEGKSEKNKNDRILDIKLQETPTAISFLSQAERDAYLETYPNPAQRQAIAYKALVNTKDDQGNPLLADELLGWMHLFDKEFSVRERSPSKDTFPTDPVNEKKAFLKVFPDGGMTAADLGSLASQWGKILATAHSRAADGDDFEGAVTSAMQGREASFDRQVTLIARAYADQVRADWDAFLLALAPDPNGAVCVLQ